MTRTSVMSVVLLCREQHGHNVLVNYNSVTLLTVTITLKWSNLVCSQWAGSVSVTEDHLCHRQVIFEGEESCVTHTVETDKIRHSVLYMDDTWIWKGRLIRCNIKYRPLKMTNVHILQWVSVCVTVTEEVVVYAVLFQVTGALLDSGMETRPVRPPLSRPVNPPWHWRPIWNPCK